MTDQLSPGFDPSAAQSPGAFIDPATGRWRLTIHPRGNPQAQPKQQPFNPDAAASPNADPFADLGTDQPPGAPPQAAGAQGDPFADLGTDTAPPPQRQVGLGEAIGRGAVDAGTFGLAPTIVGLTGAGQPPVAPGANPDDRPVDETSNLEAMGRGLALAFGSHPDPTARDAFERGRQQTLADQQLAREQDPWAFFGGQLLGGIMTMPSMGSGVAAPLSARILRGAVAGAGANAAYSAGSAVSQEKPLPEIASEAAIGGVEGAGLGGVLGGTLGPRAPRPAVTPGARAAETAAALGAPIPKGIASDNRAVRSATSAIASVPIVGARVRNALDATREAAGNVINQSGVDDAISANKQRINNLYDTVRSQIGNPDQVMPMPRTAAAVFRVRAQRVGARRPNPDVGLEQFETIGNQGASFNGAHRARIDAREAGDALNPHPGYNASDYNLITRAMTADIRANVHTQGGPRALSAFDRAEGQFGPISTANKFLNRIARARGPGAGLDEIGYNAATGEFSLDKFVNAINKLDPRARPFVPEPGHARNIQAIFAMGEHIKSSMRERNTSHTSTPLIMWDLARDAILTGAALGAGVVSGASVLGSAALAAPVVLLAHWLSSPARAASMAAWSRAYQAFVSQPSPGRIGVLTVATRNLANTLGLDANAMVKAIQSRVQTTLPGRAEDQGSEQQQ
jgi:hypothetical protein